MPKESHPAKPRHPATEALFTWFETYRRDLPWRGDPDPYRVWVSEIMLQQTRVDQAGPYYDRFVTAFPTVQDLASASTTDVLKIWEGLGYYARARNLHRAARVVVDEHGGVVPSTLEGLRMLHGIGPYTAAAVASIAFGIAVPAVDGNVSRVLARVFLIDDTYGSSVFKTRVARAAEALVPVDSPGTFNEAIMELGALVCTPRSPSCTECPLEAMCGARAANDVERLPVRKPRPTVPHRNVAVAVIQDDRGRVLIQRRPESGLLGGLWEFPGGKIEPGESTTEACVREVREELGIDVAVVRGLAPIRHAYTHFKVTLQPSVCRLEDDKVEPRGSQPVLWVAPDSLADYPFPRANRKLIEQLAADPAFAFVRCPD